MHNQNKRVISMVFLLLASLICKAQKRACPVNFNKESLEIVKKDPAAFNGKIVAFDCAMVRQEKAYNNKPYILVAVNGYIDATIWVASTVKIDFAIENKNLRMMGYFSTFDKDDTVSRKYNADGYHVLAIAIVNVDDKKMDMLPAAKAMGQEWIDGKIPEAVTR